MYTGRELPNKILKFKGKWRACQKRVLDRYSEYSRDRKFHIIAAPGAGKTTLGIELIKRINRPTLILAPSITIRQQWIERISEAFLTDPSEKDIYLSQDLKNPKLITAATYQSLHSAMTRFSGELAEVNDEFKTVEQVDYSDFDLIKNFKDFGLGTLCLDECHHLRNEWWKALEDFKKSFENVFTVALTATPPYDSTPALWERYIGVCGEIDEEITVPELVKEGTLCPHQDYVYLNYPAEEEKSKLKNFTENANDIYRKLMVSDEFAHAVAGHRFFSGYASADEALENPDYLMSMIIFLHEKGIPGANRYQNILGYKRIQPMSPAWMEILLQGFLYDDKESFDADEDYRKKLINSLKARGLIEKRKIALRMSNRVEKILINSVGKCESIKTIVSHEYADMDKDLRLLILTDYIRKEYESALGDAEKDVLSIGVLPIFEQLRRECEKKGSKLRLGVLCGTIVIIPAEAQKALLDIAEEPERISFKKAGQLSDYVKVEVSGDGHFITGLVSTLFAKGYIRALIGTKSLLGEGWDSPCINSLIMASFVGSYMLSNQMRGRAIRVYRPVPDKTSNIWHLVCVKPPDSQNNSYDNGESEDYQMLCRRMENFMGLNYESDTIESGIERLTALKPPFTPSAVESTNGKMLSLSSQRDKLSAKWQRSVADYKEMDIAEETHMEQKDVPPLIFKNNLHSLIKTALILLGIGAAAALIFFGFHIKGAGIITGVYSAVTLIILAVKIKKLHGLRNPALRLEAYAGGIHDAIRRAGLFESKSAGIITENGENRSSVSLIGGTGHDKKLFAQCVRQFFGKIDNQRYILYNKDRAMLPDGFFAVPEVFSKRREDAELFASSMKPFIGNYQAVYTRNEGGRKLLLKGRIRTSADRSEPRTCKKVRSRQS